MSAPTHRMGRAAPFVLALVSLCVAQLVGCGAGDPSDFAADEATRHLELAEAARFAVRRNGVGGAPPTFDATRVDLPAGAAVAWSLRMPVGARLEASKIELAPAATAELVVQNDAGEQTVAPLAACVSSCRVDLSEFSGQVVRVTARASAETAGASLGLVDGAIVGEPWPTVAPRPPLDQTPDIFIYLIDTLRADKLGAYGHEGGLTPAIDAFAAEATVFDGSLAQGNWTKPSVTSMFTGLDARVHRVNTLYGRLPDEATTLAEQLGAHGYDSSAVVTNGLVDDDFGYGQGYDRFLYERGRAPGIEGLEGNDATKPAIDSDVAHDTFVRLLDESDASKPRLVYVHVLDPHAPHFPPEPYKSRFVPELDRFDLGSMTSVREMIDLARRGERPPERVRRQFEQLYDAEIAHNDHQFGRFIETLRERGLYDDALVVFLSDHGESFWQKGQIGHSRTLEEGLLRVPLIVKAPGQTEGRRVASMAQHIDLMPTLLDYANAPHPGELPGESLRPLLELGDEVRADAPPRLAVIAGMKSTAIRMGRWKLVKQGQAPVALYDLDADPGEERNVAGAHRVLTRFMLEEAARREARWEPLQAETEKPGVGVTAEKQAELRALGYLE